MKSRTSFSKAFISGITWLIIYCLLVAGIGGFAYFVASNDSDADLVYDNLDYAVQLRNNGDMTIKQTVTVNMSDRNRPWRQLFQTYTLSSKNLTNINDISVMNLTTGEKYERKNFSEVNTKRVSTYLWNEKAARSWYFVDTDTQQDIADTDTLPVSQPEKVFSSGIQNWDGIYL